MKGRGQKFIATIDDSQEDIKAIATKFEQQGIIVEKIFALSGIITGVVENFDSLRNNSENLKILHLEKPKQLKGF